MCLFFFFFATQYNSSLSSFVPNFRILTQVVAEKSLTEISLQTGKQTNTITEKAKNYIPSIYYKTFWLLLRRRLVNAYLGLVNLKQR